jgi:hypothetical protein|tara:strand:+ start:430 stop:717 length:288 start_codon:yes stop_codon:yes gene_type:complete
MSEKIKEFEDWLQDATHQQLQDKLMEMPVLETPAEEIHKELHSINTFHAYKNEVHLRGKDEDGTDFSLWIDAWDFVSWVDMLHIKQTLKKHITKL